MNARFCLCLVLYISTSVDSYKFVGIPLMWTSHFMEFLGPSKELINRGHEVYFIVASNCMVPPEITNSGVKILTYASTGDEIGVTEEFQNDAIKSTITGDDAIFFKYPKKIWIQQGDGLFNDKALFKKVKSMNFDYAIVDGFFFAPFLMMYPHKLGIPYIALTALLGLHWDIGVPHMPSVYPNQNTDFPADMSFRQRAMNLFMYIALPYIINSFNNNPDDLMERYYPEAPAGTTMLEIFRNADLWLIDQDPILDYPQPTVPHVIFVGGLSTFPAKPLEPNLKNFIESSQQGLILVSFGAYMAYLPEQFKQILSDVLSSLDQQVIWRYKGKAPKSVGKNIKLMEWIPQNDILGHPNTKLFIGHGGSIGQYEAVYHGVPMISIPCMPTDQTYNAIRLEHKNFGIALSWRTLTAERLNNAINEILMNPKYAKSVKRASQMFRDRPSTPQERAADSIIHATKYGTKHLQTQAKHMSKIKFFMLDVLFVFTLVALMICVMFWFILKCLVRKFINRQLKAKAD